MFNVYGGAFSWKSELQTVVAASTTKAEYIAQVFTTKVALWIKKRRAIFLTSQQLIFIYAGNLRAINLTKY